MPFGYEYETVQQTAARLGVTVRAIQKQAAAGKIPGAVRHGRAWMIPRGYEPVEKNAAPENNGIPDVYRISPFRTPLPLLTSSYIAGRATEFINALPDEDDRRIAQAEYQLYNGNMEEAAIIAEPYMASRDPSLRFSSSMICVCANLARGHSHLTRFALHNLQTQVNAVLASDAPRVFQAIAIFATATMTVMFHMPPPEGPSAGGIPGPPAGRTEAVCLLHPGVQGPSGQGLRQVPGGGGYRPGGLSQAVSGGSGVYPSGSCDGAGGHEAH